MSLLEAPKIKPPSEAAKLAAADPKGAADAWMKDDNLARAKGGSTEQVAARQRAAALFCEIHFPNDTAERRAQRLAAIDLGCPVVTTNARGLEVENTKKGFLGMGRKKAYLISESCLPKGPEDPIYALEYTPVKR